MEAVRPGPGPAQFSPRFRWAGYLLGFGLGGFFDGILLHQILQWHHLLSAIGTGALGDLRAQVVADGVFHALMYLVAAVGLGLFVQSRQALAAPKAARFFVAVFLVGFGAWHIVDTLFSHWLTGIHRIRMDDANPLLWDLIWLVLFGLVPLAAGLALRRGTGRGGEGLRVVTALPLLLVAATLVSGLVAARPADAGEATVTIVLRPGIGPQRLLAALAQTDSRIVWGDATGSVWVLRPDPTSRRFDFYRHGALYVSGTALPAGCSAFLKAGKDTAL